MRHEQFETSEPIRSNDYHQLPVTDKQIAFARQIAARTGTVIPWECQQDRQSLSRWIDRHRGKPSGRSGNAEPSSKQVQFAERIARYKKRQVPDECFRDRTLMSRWIDSNK